MNKRPLSFEEFQRQVVAAMLAEYGVIPGQLGFSSSAMRLAWELNTSPRSLVIQLVDQAELLPLQDMPYGNTGSPQDTFAPGP